MNWIQQTGKLWNCCRKMQGFRSKSIADKVSLTSPTVSARIDRLEKDGVITGYRASVNPEVFDYRIKAFINLEVEPVRKKGILIRTSPTVRM